MTRLPLPVIERWDKNGWVEFPVDFSFILRFRKRKWFVLVGRHRARIEGDPDY